MAKTGFSARVLTGSSYTIPTGKYVVCNAFAGTNPANAGGSAGIVTFNLNGQLYLNAVGTSGDRNRAGPFVFNAGDVLAVPADFAVFDWVNFAGFMYDTSTVKAPFSSFLTPSATYTVPGGKYITFCSFSPIQIYYILAIDGIGALSVGLGGVYPAGGPITSGPFIANSGQVISVLKDTSGNNPGSFVLSPKNGLYGGSAWINGFVRNQGT